MNILIRLIVVIISQCMCTPKHQVVHLKYKQFLSSYLNKAGGGGRSRTNKALLIPLLFITTLLSTYLQQFQYIKFGNQEKITRYTKRQKPHLKTEHNQIEM